MADRSITIKIGVDVTGLVSGLKTAAGATKDLADKTEAWVGRNSEHITALSTSIGAAGEAMTSFAKASVLSAAQFDQAMSGVKAVTRESAQGMSELRTAALDAGRSTVYSASESAGAIEKLAQAGLSTADIVGGGLTGALDLAAASEIDIADAAEIATTTLSQFGLKGSDLTHVADLLTAGAGKAQGGMTNLSAALKQSGLVASQTGLSVEETVGTLTAFASAGLVGSEAGASFSAMLQDLASPAGAAEQEMERLGIAAYDAQGNFVGMSALAGQLTTALGPLPKAQRDAAMATMFGSDAIAAANILYSQGAEGIGGWIDATNDAGYAAESAAIRLDNLAGDWERLTGSVEVALIGMGEGAQGPLRALVQGATEVVDAFADLPDPIQQSLLAIVGGGGLVLLGIAGLGELAVKVHETRGAMDAMGISTKKAAIAAGGVGLAIGAATALLTMWLTKQAETRANVEALRDSLDETTGSVTESTRAIIANTLAQDRGKQGSSLGLISWMDYADAARIVGITLEDVTDAIMGNEAAIKRVNDALAAAKPTDVGMFDMYSKEADAIGTIQGVLDGQSDAIADAVAEWENYNDAMGDAGSTIPGTKSAIDEYTAAVDDGTATIGMFNDALEEKLGLLREESGVVLSEREAHAAYEEAVDAATAALEKNKQTLDWGTEAGRENQGTLTEIGRTTLSWADSMRAAGASQEELRQHVEGGRNALIEAAVAFGMSADEANDLADQMKLIPENITVGADTAPAMLAVQGALTSIGLMKATVSVFARVAGAAVGAALAGRGKASGGLVQGPGTPTSDSVPAWLSDGEYVVRAAAVAKYGVAMMDTINSGRWTVGAPPPVRMASGGVVATGSSGPLVQIGQVVAYDARDAARRIAERQRDVLVSHGLVGAAW